MAFVVVYDACVLYPASMRDILVRLAQTGLFQAKWTNEILDECFRNILQNRPDLDKARLERTRELMNQALPDALVTEYELVRDALKLPDGNDRHVLAAAIRCGAQVIVTSNLKHFPDEQLAPYDIEAQDPDTFVLHVISLNADLVGQKVVELAAEKRAPPLTPHRVVDTLEKRGLVKAGRRLREILTRRDML